jgi:hypothetical protein
MKKKKPWTETTNKDGAKAFFDDGLFYLWEGKKKPKHISFSVSTETN